MEICVFNGSHWSYQTLESDLYCATPAKYYELDHSVRGLSFTGWFDYVVESFRSGKSQLDPLPAEQYLLLSFILH